MTEPTIHPDDPLFLVSRQLDGDLSEAELKALVVRVSASPELTDAARRMQAVDEAVRRSMPGLPALDWAREAEMVLGRIADAFANPEDHRIDAALDGWSRATSVEDADLAGRVLSKVTAAKAKPRRLVLPWAVPLAAAAAIAMIVMGPWFGGEAPQLFDGPTIASLPAPVVDVVMGPVERSTGAEPTDSRSVPAQATNVVVFDRGSAVALRASRANRDPSFITVGVARATLAEEVPPL